MLSIFPQFHLICPILDSFLCRFAQTEVNAGKTIAVISEGKASQYFANSATIIDNGKAPSINKHTTSRQTVYYGGSFASTNKMPK